MHHKLLTAFVTLLMFVVACSNTVSAADLSEQENCEGFVSLFDGKTLDGWVGATKGYFAKDGKIVCLKNGGGNLFTEKEYSDFNFRFEFKLTPGANNGLGIRTPLKGNAAYVGMELQILDNTAEKYSKLKPYQYHGSVYGVAAAKRGFLNPVGEWNSQEVIAKGRHITVILNGETIVDVDLDEASKNGTVDGNKHPGLKNEKGHIGFLGHGADLEFRNLRIKDLSGTLKPVAEVENSSQPSDPCCEEEENFLGRLLGGLFGGLSQ